MGLLSALNPFTFGRKHQAAWSALMASYTFLHLNAALHVQQGGGEQGSAQFSRDLRLVTMVSSDLPRVAAIMRQAFECLWAFFAPRARDRIASACQAKDPGTC